MKPYKKQYDENGKVLPIQGGAYINVGENRKQRRANLQKNRHRGNHKGHSIVFAHGVKFFRKIQFIGSKAVFHYSLTK